ncbi:glycoside hydrolase family 2 protein [Paenibacillus odorifer]|uniref:glycoside hydrolase family 2 protein n=1 Tax=Paenibacillus odorifer TaxID=189426 RepID=UPI0015954686|nr:glycoside hydrolase family 2 TIM barrel-domain containing protein [Paenibacillus odorifer]
MNNEINWPRPCLNPLPHRVSNTGNSLVSLCGGDWKLNLSPAKDFFDPATDLSGWSNTTVPLQIDAGEEEYAYARELYIPAEWEQNRVFLRFDGANCYARVFINGSFVRDHYGGFVTWDCDITDYIVPGQAHRLVVGITDKSSEVNPFHRGGLIREVTLYTVPQTYLARLHVETVFDGNYSDATLTVSTMIAGGNGTVELMLTSPDGEELPLPPLAGNAGIDLSGSYPITDPLKWDSEHPYLYTLTALVITEEGCVEVVVKKIGFRQIERRGNEVFVNGQLLKLRGINRHDIHPVTGRALPRVLMEEDVRLFKEANINFIRTSHYPPSPYFLDLCDQYGMYVEDEIAVSFLGYGTWYSQSDPEFTSCFMGQFAEMIERDRSHPSVIIWSLANESYWGDNLALMNAYAHKEDPGRLTIFSYPLTQMEDDLQVDIWSVHYDKWDRDLADLTDCFRRSHREPGAWPVLHDESTHIPCYNRRELQRDPGARDFWGETIYRFWDRLWKTDGALGCAIWAGIDDIWVKDENSFTFPWGIIDGWRRTKPEYWHTRKGYSPIVLLGEPESQNGHIVQTVQNRFNHTCLSEIRIGWKLEGEYGEIQGPAISPRGEGLLVIPSPFRPGAKLELTFTDPFGYQVDEAMYLLEAQPVQLPCLSGGEPTIEWREKFVRISGLNFSLSFSVETGLITEGYHGNTLLLTGGPFLTLTGLELRPWKLESMDVCPAEGNARITLNGSYGEVQVCFVISVDASGLMETVYEVKDMPYASPREIAIGSGITSHSGGYDEIGVSFTVSGDLNTLSWRKMGLWNVYPDSHLARLEGTTAKFNPEGLNHIASPPGWDWRMDEKDTALFGKYDIGRRGTRDFASMKPSIVYATIGNDSAAFTALSDGSDSVRMEVGFKPEHIISDQHSAIVYKGTWFRQDTRHRSLGGTEMWSKTAGDRCEYTFTGTGIAWISSLDRICGIASVYIDGELKDPHIDLGVSRAGKNARGYTKYYRQLVYSIQDLPMGKHTLRIEVTGEKAAGSNNSYVNIDHFLVMDGNEIGDTRFLINSEFNYPELSWGDYTKPPIIVSSGYKRCIYTKLGR